MDSLVELKNGLKVDNKYNLVKNKIINRIRDLDLVNQKYKLDTEFLSFVCNLVENLVKRNDKILKKELAIDVIGTLFELSINDKEILSKNIDFLCSQNGLIKKVSYYKMFKVGLREWFKKK